jgi:ATP-dependent helicase/nuclease subunit A
MGQAPVEEESADCIKLMTIHAAKGLEWPVVIVPDFGAGNASHDNGGWRYHRRLGVITARREGEGRQWPCPARLIDDLNAAEDEAERRRLLYVAATRCRDHLVLSSALDLKRAAQSWLAWLAEATELDTDSATCHVAGIAVTIRKGEDLKEPVSGPKTDRQELTLPTAEVVRRRVEPVELDLNALHRFTVTGLSAYRKCPASYELRYLQGLPEQQASAGLPAPSHQLSALERGSLVHRALEIVGSQGVDAAEDAVKLALKVQQLDPAEHQHILSMLTWYLTSDLYRGQVQTATRLRSEMPLSFALEGALIEGKLDAVAEHDGGDVLEVIDYKTGYEEAKPPEEHIFQLGLYCAGLELLGKRVRGASIVYLDAQRVSSLQPGEFNAARDQAAAAIAGIRAGQFATELKAECEGCRLAWVCRRA